MDTRPVFPATTGQETAELFHGDAPEQGLGLDALAALQDVTRLVRVQNGRFFGYVLGSGEPIAAAADLLASVLNQNVTAWRSGPAAVTIERTVIDWLATAIGCGGSRGSLTGGGSAANLMALAMAREAKLAANERGLKAAADAVFYASEQVHMSIPKAVALLGIGRENLKLVPVDDLDRMIPSALESAIQSDRAAGRVPMAVIATAGTVNTGAIDPLGEIAVIARRHGIWLHVDGAYGALAAIAAPEKFPGLALADSVSLDPHKWLYQPLDCGCLLYRDATAAQKAFAHTGDYAKVLNADPIEGFAFFEESMELSRRFRALKLWLSIRYHGMAAFRESIRKNLLLAQRLASAIASNPQLELMAPVELSAVCFRCKGQGSNEEVDRHNQAVLKRVVERGRVYLSNATIRGKFCLRACIVNHRTTEADVHAVVEEVLAAM
ncbi:MAG TPA: pyridoxal-dependent decarboxylase [Terriglobales bacterium]|nr:pyridoxal-dependent decarboxylase [Terriglobales bacterium]